MRIWDRFNRQGKYYGIYALDSHAKLKVSEKIILRFPSYGATFRILNIYVKVERELEKNPQAAAATIIAAMRRGNFFSVIESLAAANGFENYYQEKDGRQVEMGGDALEPGGLLVLKLPFTFSTDVRIVKDGEPFQTIQDNSRQEIAVPVSAPGVYRCEVSLASGRFSNLPWILANPIFIARPRVLEKPEPRITLRLPLAAARDYFQVEKNSQSRATLQVDGLTTGEAVTRFTFELRRESSAAVDFWTALARRENLDFSGYRGFIFEASSSRPMRFWLQFRTGAGGSESAFQHSFLAGENWRRFAIPFASFYRLYGSGHPPDLKKVSSFFFTIDNGNSFAGARGEISLRAIGLY
jgi:hypothetical protein